MKQTISFMLRLNIDTRCQARVKRRILYSVIKDQGRIEEKGKRREWSERGQLLAKKFLVLERGKLG